MGEEQGQVGTSLENEQKSPEELQREIEETRRDLGDTAAALAEKTDIKARATAKAQENPVATAAFAAFAIGFGLGRITST